MSRRSGLGRGLAALIPPSVPDEDGEADPKPEASDGGSSTDVAGSSNDVEEPSGTVTEPPGDEPGVAASPDPDGDRDRTGSAPPSPPSPDLEADGVAAAADEPVRPATTGGSHESERETSASVPASGGDGVPPLVVADPTSPTVAEATDVPTPIDVPTPLEVAEVSSPVGQARVPAAAATLAEVAPGSIVPNPRQPREVFDPEELANLAVSLADIGVLQPLVVRSLDDGSYELVAGERRLRAAVLAGLETVPVVIRHTEDADLLKEALVENIHRVQLNPLEEGAAYQQLLEEFGVTQEDLAARLGRSRPAISNAIRLLQLPSGVQRRVASGVLSAGHAKVLLAIEHPEQQVRLADRIVAEGLSVRATEELVRLRLLDEPSRSPAPRRRPATAPGLVELQDDLSDALEARVKISMGAKRGKLAIEFASVEDLERLVSIIANGLEGGRDVAAVPPPSGDGGAPEQP